MKKLFILTIAAAFFFAACSDSSDDPNKNGGTNDNTVNPATFTVPEQNTAMVVKFSGTNCPPCGGWGWTAFSDIINRTPNSTHLIAYSQNFVAEHMITSEASAMDDAQGITGYPSFSVNDVPQLSRQSGSVDVTKEKQMCEDAAKAHEAAAVEMNAKIKYEIKDGKIYVHYKIKAFKDMPENNYFAIYVLEDKVKQYQAGHSEGANAIHKHVLRKGVDGAWGFQIGAMTSGQEISGTKEIAIGEDYSTGLTWAEDMIEVIGVMRYQLSSVNLFINACEGERVN